MENINEMPNPFADFANDFQYIFEFGPSFQLHYEQGFMENHYKKLCQDFDENKGNIFLYPVSSLLF